MRTPGRLIRIGLAKVRMLFSRTRQKIESIYTLCAAAPRALSFYGGSLPFAMHRILRVLMREGVRGIIRRANILMHGAGFSSRKRLPPSYLLYGEMPPSDPSFMPKVSIIVPNFNHAKYLTERLESVYQQTYSNFEVILLDDCSKDESLSILRDYASRYQEKTLCCFNETNSGGVFNQWKKGFELATGELVWIAESDDFCSLNFLEELVRCFQNTAVMLAFSHTKFVSGSTSVEDWTLEEYLSDLNLDTWDQPFIKSAQSMVKSGWAVKNLVPNVSGAVFRNPGKMSLLDDSEWLQLRLCGDWVFYLSIIRGGLVAYSPHATNFYRQHRLNTSVNAQKEELYYREHQVVAKYLTKLFWLDRSDLEKQEKHLYRHWCSRNGKSKLSDFRKLYDIEEIWQLRGVRKPNLVMAVYALAAGGGETFPIMLANLLYKRGYAVTLLNFNQQSTEPGVRSMLLNSIPLLELKDIEFVHAVFYDMGIELVHSHHAWVDISLATMLINSQVRQVVSLHGMYEMMPPAQLKNLMPLLERRIDRFVFTAEKNLQSFSPEFRLEKGFCKIDNALEIANITPIPRMDLGVDPDDFVLCLVARAIPDKGWEEAIDAVSWANNHSARKIHLFLIGDGPEYDRLKPITRFDFVHFLGFRSNIRDYYSSSDMGFLPSRFKGESFPLVLIDCLHSGKPVIASNIGEIHNMLSSERGLAGELFDLEGWSIPVEVVGQIILKLANDSNAYKKVLCNVSGAASKFSPDVMVDKYEGVYRECLAEIKNDSVFHLMENMGG